MSEQEKPLREHDHKDKLKPPKHRKPDDEGAPSPQGADDPPPEDPPDPL